MPGPLCHLSCIMSYYRLQIISYSVDMLSRLNEVEKAWCRFRLRDYRIYKLDSATTTLRQSFVDEGGVLVVGG